MEKLVVYPKRGRMLGYGLMSLITSVFGFVLTILSFNKQAPVHIGVIEIIQFLVCGFSSIFFIKRAVIH